MDRGSTTNATPQPATKAPAWDGPTLTDPHQRSDKADRIRDMFTAIADSYDLNNRIHSFLLDQRWRRYTVKRAEVRPGDAVIDVACGTGDLAEAFARTPATSVIGIDFTHAMLERARHRQHQSQDQSITSIAYVEGDAMALPLADACCDVVSIAFGLRNVQDPKAGHPGVRSAELRPDPLGPRPLYQGHHAPDGDLDQPRSLGGVPVLAPIGRDVPEPGSDLGPHAWSGA